MYFYLCCENKGTFLVIYKKYTVVTIRYFYSVVFIWIWIKFLPQYFFNMRFYRLWYFFQHWWQKLTNSLRCPQVKEGDILDSVVPGEKVEVQIAVKCALNPHAGHWSRWSQPVQEVVPQSAGVDYILRPTSHQVASSLPDVTNNFFSCF